MSEKLTKTGKPRKNPFDKCRAHAATCAQNHGTQADCPYKNKIWRAVWFRALETAQQIYLFDQDQAA